jgi:hypothetical protein
LKYSPWFKKENSASVWIEATGEYLMNPEEAAEANGAHLHSDHNYFATAINQLSFTFYYLCRCLFLSSIFGISDAIWRVNKFEDIN